MTVGADKKRTVVGQLGRWAHRSHSICWYSIKLGQFLLTDDGHVKLNDFNRAEIMLFNEKDQEYCPYMTSIGGGVWRAPEEYVGTPLDDKIDVWAMGTCCVAVGGRPLLFSSSLLTNR